MNTLKTKRGNRWYYKHTYDVIKTISEESVKDFVENLMNQLTKIQRENFNPKPFDWR